MELHLGSMQAPAPGMSRYEFTTREGFHAATVEARTASEARVKAEGRSGLTGLICTHLSDYHGPGGIDAIFYYGPDAVELDA